MQFRACQISRIVAMGLIAVTAVALLYAGTASTAEAVAGPVAIPVQGANRVATAIEASKKFGTAANVVLATGADFPDALGGSALAGAVQGPILLTGGVALEGDVLAEIDRLEATKVYILGGTGAVSAAIEADLEAEGLTVERIAGANRYATAKAIADKTIALLGESYTGGAFIATGLGYADALAAAPLMYAQGMPLVLVDAAGTYTLSAGMEVVDILGGTGAVPASVETALGTAAGERLAGANRYDTAIAIATYGVTEFGMGWNNLGIATGESFPDALCAGPLLGKNNSVLLMTQTATLTAATEAKLESLAGTVDQYYLFGGTGAIAAGTRTAIQTALTPVVIPDTDRHRLPTSFCTTGCHGVGTDVTGDGAWRIDDIHAGLAVGGCGSCHPPFAGATRDCETCHDGVTVRNGVTVPIAHSGAHPAVASTSAEACTQAGCHGTDVVALHTACTSCHNATTVLTGATCETCHGATDAVHAAVAAHTVVNTGGGCFDAYCHGTDVTTMHSTDFRLSGEEPPGCAACHNETVTASVTCLGACHAASEFGAWHNDTIGHTALIPAVEANSTGCISCHGSDLFAVTPGQHAGCSCHGAARGAGTDSCEGCHTDPLDPLAEYPYHVEAHTAWEQTARGTQSTRCVGCHGPQLVAIRPLFGFEFKEGHGGCVCHYYDTLFTEDFQPTGATTAEATECVSCHGGVFDPHGGAFLSSY